MRLASLTTALALTLHLSVAGAAPQPDAGATAFPLRPLPPPAQQAVSQSAFLRSLLPAGTLAYLRIPSLWGLLGATKGALHDRAVGSAPYAQALLAIRGGVLETLIPEFPPEGQALAELLLGHLVSPLELAVAAPTQGAAAPLVLLAGTLDLADADAVNQLLERISGQAQGLQVARPLAADSPGLLLVAGAVPLEVYFEAPSRRLYLTLADPTGQGIPLPKCIAALTPTTANPMAAAEQALDTSAEGLFLWIDPAPLLRLAEAGGKVAEVAGLRTLGISEAKYLALAVGASNGKQRIKLVLDMPPVGFRAFLPTLDAKLDLNAAGHPTTVAMLGLPGPEDLSRLESSLAGVLPPDALAAYAEIKAAIPEAIGLTLEDLLGAFGDELLLVSDQAGTYQALRLRDKRTYRRVLDHLVKRFDLRYEVRDLLGTRFHHLVVPPTPVGADDTELPPLLARLNQTQGHLYWIEEGDYLLLSSLPQTLMDYRYSTERVPVGDWLRQSQGLDPAGALLLLTTRGEGVPRLMYEINLLVLSGLSELVGHPLDLFALPSARELAIPAAGAYSLQISSSPTQIGLELAYETNPIELLLAGGGLQSLAVAGVVAAIAIPAYQDYQARVQVQPGLALAQGIQAALTEFQVVNDRFPTAEELEALFGALPELPGIAVELEPDSGVIYVHFHGFDLGDAAELSLIPEATAEGLSWRCDGGFQARFGTGVLCTQP